MGKAWIQRPLEHGKKICSSFKSNEVIKIKSSRKSRNKSEKFSKKRKFRNPGCYRLAPGSSRSALGDLGSSGGGTGRPRSLGRHLRRSGARSCIRITNV